MMDWTKLEMFFQSVFFRFSFIVFFCLFIGVFIYAYYTEGGNVPVTETTSLQGMQASAPMSGDIVTMEEPHRTRREMQAWIVEAVSELLNFDRQSKSGLLNQVRSSFTDVGFSQYQEWLQTNAMAVRVESGEFRLSAIVDETPVQLNAGAVAGAYRWLYDVPVVISLQPVDIYADQPVETIHATVRMQLARTENSDAPNLLVIESWSLRPRR